MMIDNQPNNKKCCQCGNSFISKMPDRAMQFCSRKCEVEFATNIAIAMWEKALEVTENKELRETTY